MIHQTISSNPPFNPPEPTPIYSPGRIGIWVGNIVTCGLVSAIAHSILSYEKESKKHYNKTLKKFIPDFEERFNKLKKCSKKLAQSPQDCNIQDVYKFMDAKKDVLNVYNRPHKIGVSVYYDDRYTHQSSLGGFFAFFGRIFASLLTIGVAGVVDFHELENEVTNKSAKLKHNLDKAQNDAEQRYDKLLPTIKQANIYALNLLRNYRVSQLVLIDDKFKKNTSINEQLNQKRILLNNIDNANYQIGQLEFYQQFLEEQTHLNKEV